jgi:hypothetical protein
MKILPKLPFNDTKTLLKTRRFWIILYPVSSWGWRRYRGGIDLGYISFWWG